MSSFVTDYYLEFDPEKTIIRFIPLPGKIVRQTPQGYDLSYLHPREDEEVWEQITLPREARQVSIKPGETLAAVDFGFFSPSEGGKIQVTFPESEQFQEKIKSELTEKNRVYAIVNPDQFKICNVGESSVNLLLWDEDTIGSSIVNIEYALFSETKVHPFEMAFDYFCAKKRLKRSKRALTGCSVFESSLHKSIKIFSVNYGVGSNDVFSHSVSPIEVEAIEKSEIKNKIEQHKNQVLFFFKSSNFIGNVNDFLYFCHRYAEILKKDNIGRWLFESDERVFAINRMDGKVYEDEDFSTNFPVMDLESEDFYERHFAQAQILDSFSENMNNIFTFNVKKNHVPEMKMSFKHVIAVCAGTYPVKLVQSLNLFEQKLTMIDQNYASIEFWKKLSTVTSREDLIKLFLAFNNWPQNRYDWVVEKLEKTFNDSIEELFSCLDRISPSSFVWDNFIERPDCIGKLVNENEPTLIWLSNSFESRINKLIYGEGLLQSKFEQLIDGIEKKTFSKFELTGMYKGHFRDSMNKIVSTLMSDDFSDELTQDDVIHCERTV